MHDCLQAWDRLEVEGQSLLDRLAEEASLVNGMMDDNRVIYEASLHRYRKLHAVQWEALEVKKSELRESMEVIRAELREHFLATKRYDHLLEQWDERLRREAKRQEQKTMDELAMRGRQD
jgi:flagellar biosynthesis chaperone FliJ